MFFTLVQVLVLNQVLFSSYINPFIYILLIISLPIKTPSWFLLIFAFSNGFLIDIFSGTIGFHSSSNVLIAALKPLITKITIPHNILNDTDEINAKKIGIKSYFLYSLILISIHHLCLFMIEHAEINIFILAKIFLSTIFSFIIIFIAQQFFCNSK